MKQARYLEEETVYVAGTDLDNARWYYEHASHRVKDTPQEAYDAVGYFERNELVYEVFEFKVRSEIRRIEPPYTQTPERPSNNIN